MCGFWFKSVRDQSGSQGFYGSRSVTLTFDPTTLEMSSLSRGPGLE